MSYSIVNWSKKQSYGPYWTLDDGRKARDLHVGPNDEWTIFEIPQQAGAGIPLEEGKGEKRFL